MATGRNRSDDDVTLKDVESYVRKHDIHVHMRESIVQLCIHRPHNPFAFLRDYFDRLDQVIYTYYIGYMFVSLV